jgi:hypothetical protein
VNLWMKRAIGVAALGGGLLALSAGAASAQDVSADATARLGRPTSAEVRVCADGRVLSRLLGCTDRAGGTVQAGRAGDGSGAILARVRVPRAADANVSIGARRDRPSTTASGQASATRRARAAAAADTSPSADATASLSRPRAGRLLEAGALDGLAGETPAGIGVLESGPIASGNQVDVDAGDVSPSVPVTVCGNSAGVLGDASASCGAGGGTTTPGSGSGVDLDTILDTVLATVLDTSTGGTTDPGAGVGLGVDVGVGGDISTGGIIAPTPPGTTPGTTPGRTDTVGTPGSGSTGTSGIPGTLGLTPGGAGATTAFAPLRGSVSGSGALPFTGAGSDGLALFAAGLLAAGALFVRATRPAAATEGGGDR